jgi:long-chain acyl-CoA synthetase
LLRERGLRPGDRVGIMLPNVAEFATLYFGVLRAGVVVVPMNPLLKAREVNYYLTDSGAGLIFAWRAFGAEARGGAQPAGAQVVAVDPASFADVIAPVPPDHEVADRDDEDTAVQTGTDLQYYDDAAALSDPRPQTDHYLAPDLHD